MPPDPGPRRRSSDAHEEALEQRLINLFREEVSSSRHQLREEVAVQLTDVHLKLGQIDRNVQAGNLADVTERAENAAAIQTLQRDVKDLREDVDEHNESISELQAEKLASHRVGELKRYIVTVGLAIIGTVVASVAFLANHIH